MNVGDAVRFRIRELCEERELTVNKLSLICGLTQSTLSNIMTGRNHSTTVSTVKMICDGLEISLSSFFDSPLFDKLEQELR